MATAGESEQRMKIANATTGAQIRGRLLGAHRT
jgi:hypothetical protein